jgi:hypothetical protein
MASGLIHNVSQSETRIMPTPGDRTGWPQTAGAVDPGSDETIFHLRRKRPETEGKIPMTRRIKGAIMLISILNLIYREFLKSAVPGMASLGGGQQ